MIPPEGPKGDTRRAAIKGEDGMKEDRVLQDRVALIRDSILE